MLTRSQITNVEKLLKEGRLSWRKIAKRTGISRGTIHAIAHGKRTPRVGRLVRKPLAVRATEVVLKTEADTKRLVGRCPLCGVKVSLPCLECEIEAAAIRRRGKLRRTRRCRS